AGVVGTRRRAGRQWAYCACAGTLTIGTGAAAATVSIVNDRIGRISALPGCDTNVLPPCVEPAHAVQARKGRAIGATLAPESRDRIECERRRQAPPLNA